MGEQRIVFLSDIHIPFIDQKAWRLAERVIDDAKPHVVYLGGDIIDNYAVSFYPTDPSQHPLDATVAKAIEFLNSLRDRCPDAKFYYHEGNHEERLVKYVLRNANRLSPLLTNRLSIPTLLELDKLHITYNNKPFQIGRLFFIHGHEKRHNRGNIVHCALTLLRYIKRNLIAGHFHKFDTFIEKELDGSLNGAWINGCLCDLSLMPFTYEKIDTAIKGLSVILFSDRYFKVEQMIFMPRGDGYVCKGNGTLYETWY